MVYIAVLEAAADVTGLASSSLAIRTIETSRVMRPKIKKLYSFKLLRERMDFHIKLLLARLIVRYVACHLYAQPKQIKRK